MPDTIQDRIDQLALIMLDMPPAMREQIFVAAFDQVEARHGSQVEIPPSIVAFTAAVYRRIAELEQCPSGSA